MSKAELPIPGSVVLVDLNGQFGGAHATEGSQHDIVLSPVPSNDVNDPLRWSWKRKQVAHAMLVICEQTPMSITDMQTP
jgi:hypothetical protein